MWATNVNTIIANPKGCPESVAPKVLPPKVPPKGSPKVLPPKVAPKAPKVAPQRFPQSVAPKVLPPKVAPQRLPPKGCPQRLPPKVAPKRFPQRLTPKVDPKSWPPRSPPRLQEVRLGGLDCRHFVWHDLSLSTALTQPCADINRPVQKRLGTTMCHDLILQSASISFNLSHWSQGFRSPTPVGRALSAPNEKQPLVHAHGSHLHYERLKLLNNEHQQPNKADQSVSQVNCRLDKYC